MAGGGEDGGDGVEAAEPDLREGRRGPCRREVLHRTSRGGARVVRQRVHEAPRTAIAGLAAPNRPDGALGASRPVNRLTELQGVFDARLERLDLEALVPADRVLRLRQLVAALLQPVTERPCGVGRVGLCSGG